MGNIQKAIDNGFAFFVLPIAYCYWFLSIFYCLLTKVSCALCFGSCALPFGGAFFVTLFADGFPGYNPTLSIKTKSSDFIWFILGLANNTL